MLSQQRTAVCEGGGGGGGPPAVAWLHGRGVAANACLVCVTRELRDHEVTRAPLGPRELR